MKPHRPRTLTFKDACWGVQFWLRVGGEAEAFNKWAKKVTGAEGGAEDWSAAHTHVAGPRVAIGLFFNWKGTADDHGFLAHECFHAADIVLRQRGLKLADESDEAWAYLLGSLVTRFLTLLG